MKFPEYTDDAYWTAVIEQYIQNNNKHPGWYNIEYYMWEYFKNCLKRNNRFFFEHPLLPVLKAEFERNACILPQGTIMYRARIDRDSTLWNEWNEYCRIESTPKQLKLLKKRGIPVDKLAAIQKEYEDLSNPGFKVLMLKEALHPQKERQAQGDVILKVFPICMLL